MKALFVSNTHRLDNPYADPSTRYRCYNRAEDLINLGHEAKVITQNGFSAKDISDFDVFVFHRPVYTKKLEKLVGLIKKSQKIAFADFDDIIFDPEIAELSPAVLTKRISLREVTRRHEAYLAGLFLFDTLIASTESLAIHAKRCFPELSVAVIQNGLSLAWLNLQPQKHTKESKYKDLAYFSGTPSHDQDFKMAEGALLKVLDEYADIRLIIYGPLRLNPLIASHERVICRKHVGYMELPKFISESYLTIAPLQNTVFNHAKSGLKFFESAICGTPVIATPIQDVSRFKHDGLITATSEADWYDGIKSFLDSGENLEIGKSLRRYAHQEASSIKQTIEFIDLVNDSSDEKKSDESESMPHQVNALCESSSNYFSDIHHKRMAKYLSTYARWDRPRRLYRKFRRTPDRFFNDSKRPSVLLIGAIYLTLSRMAVLGYKKITAAYWKLATPTLEFMRVRLFGLYSIELKPLSNLEKSSLPGYEWRCNGGSSCFELLGDGANYIANNDDLIVKLNVLGTAFFPRLISDGKVAQEIEGKLLKVADHKSFFNIKVYAKKTDGKPR